MSAFSLAGLFSGWTKRGHGPAARNRHDTDSLQEWLPPAARPRAVTCLVDERLRDVIRPMIAGSR